MRISHRWRISLAASVVAGMLFAIVMLGAYWLMWRADYGAAQESLEESLRTAVAQLRSGGAEELPEEVALPEDVSLAVFLRSGASVVRMGKLPLGDWRQGGEREFAGMRLVYQAREAGDYRVVAASDWTDAWKRLRLLAFLFALLWLPLTASVGVAAFLAAAQMYHPLERLARDAERMAAAGRVSRLADPEDPDFSPLAQGLNSMLERIDHEVRRQERLVADVAHDLRTPLTVIRGRLETALLRGGEEGYRRAIEIAIREAERLSVMADAILRSDEQPGPPTKVELSRPLRDAAERWGPSFREIGVRLEIECSICHADLGEGEWESLLDNLLDNARKHSPRDGACRMRLLANGRIRLEVEDEGAGVPESEQERVFDRFVRLEASRGSKGYGLGLYRCRKIVESRGGRIWVEGSSLGGARFVIELPAAVREPAEPIVDGGVANEGTR